MNSCLVLLADFVNASLADFNGMEGDLLNNDILPLRGLAEALLSPVRLKGFWKSAPSALTSSSGELKLLEAGRLSL